HRPRQGGLHRSACKSGPQETVPPPLPSIVLGYTSRFRIHDTAGRRPPQRVVWHICREPSSNAQRRSLGPRPPLKVLGTISKLHAVSSFHNAGSFAPCR